MERALAMESKEKDSTAAWKNKVKRRRERIKAECEKLRRFVNEEEQRLLQRLEEEESETLRSLEANVAQLSRQSSSLRTLISEIEEKSRQTPAELLKDVKRTLDRSKDVKLQETKAVSTELKTPCSIPGMVEMLRKFTGTWQHMAGSLARAVLSALGGVAHTAQGDATDVSAESLCSPAAVCSAQV
ncbi:E3 ubiquitin-protein ligase TRIM11-like [Alligator mississippiensis]|uniref:E3 ubiquitin-protein ligase TRIM11-like n=1 Tax=Alligator mississippiensis TaxID=8496 RepID=UPI002877ACA2|nr:E3 ubiquitin-protein ligase TRIM11-like [Alligator mississippiensis]